MVIKRIEKCHKRFHIRLAYQRGLITKEEKQEMLEEVRYEMRTMYRGFA